MKWFTKKPPWEHASMMRMLPWSCGWMLLCISFAAYGQAEREAHVMNIFGLISIGAGWGVACTVMAGFVKGPELRWRGYGLAQGLLFMGYGWLLLVQGLYIESQKQYIDKSHQQFLVTVGAFVMAVAVASILLSLRFHKHSRRNSGKAIPRSA